MKMFPVEHLRHSFLNVWLRICLGIQYNHTETCYKTNSKATNPQKQVTSVDGYVEQI